MLAHITDMAEPDSPELAELSVLVRVRNDIERRIAQLLNRPVATGQMGEWIAARIFDIELEASKTTLGYDSRFRTGPLGGKTVNIKTFTRYRRMLNVHPHAPLLDYYLVFMGSKGALVSSVRPFCIEKVFLFDAKRLHAELEQRHVKMGVGVGVRKDLWDASEIYPRSNNPPLAVSEPQCRQLEMFACE
jgi:hypothetical protein